MLSDDQKEALSNVGTSVSNMVGNKAGEVMGQVPVEIWQDLAKMGFTPEVIQQKLSETMAPLSNMLNAGGQNVVNAFRTDTRNMFAGAIMVTQPVFMGGAIVAMNKMASIGEDLAANSAEAKRQATLYNIDQAYWQVISLRHKQKLAQSFFDLVKKLDSDVQKMIEEGVATRSEGLSVAVKLNEAEMALTKVNNGLVLSKMLLCQLCGLPLTEQVMLVDEERSDIVADGELATPTCDAALASTLRPELRMLQNTVDMSRQLTNILRAGNLPQLAVIGGYSVSNPNVYNGFQKKFGGAWNVGVLLRIPLWNWGDVMYKVRASKGATAIATLQLEEARELIDLQVSQSNFRVQEAMKNLQMAQSSTRKADENLRIANLGFSEGVISSTTVMEAQTAWLQAQSQKIDAEIDVKLSQVNLQKALGTLQ